MPTRPSKPKRPRDSNQLAARIVQLTTDPEAAKAEADAEAKREAAKNPAAVALGKLGASKGGTARAAKLSTAKKKAIAKKAANARWSQLKR